jgi:hypothetical protein
MDRVFLAVMVSGLLLAATSMSLLVATGGGITVAELKVPPPAVSISSMSRTACRKIRVWRATTAGGDPTGSSFRDAAKRRARNPSINGNSGAMDSGFAQTRAPE